MAIRPYRVEGSDGALDIDYLPMANSAAGKAGDLIGQTGSTGLSKRLSTGGGLVITSGGGIWGFAADDYAADANGVATAPAAISTIAPGVQPTLALPTYGHRVSPAPTIAGVSRSRLRLWLASSNNLFIQRHKAGVRVNEGLIGKLCDLVWNTTTLEFEPDTGTTTLSCIVIDDVVPIGDPYYDSAGYATDAYGGLVVWHVVPTFCAKSAGLRY